MRKNRSSSFKEERSKGLKSAIGEVVRTAEIITMQLKKVCVWGGAKVVPLTLVAEKIAVVRREPSGLVLAISAFNCSKLWLVRAPALIAGDICLPSNHQHKVLSQVFFWLFVEEAGIPAGVLNYHRSWFCYR